MQQFFDFKPKEYINSRAFQDEFDFLKENLPTALYGNLNAPDGRFNDPADDEDLLIDYLYQLAEIKGFGKKTIQNPGAEPDLRGLPWFEKIAELIEYLVELILNSEPEYGTADLAAKLGEDCFGMYLPMHAFFRSEKTPWGIYLFPSLLHDRAKWLYEKHHNVFPEIKLEDYIRVKVHGTFRHEVFHYQVERFATKLEILTRTPIYKPYNRIVKTEVRGTEAWLEEALAEFAVHKSRFIGGRTNLPRRFITKILQTCSDNKPAGYKDYKCVKFNGPDNAHLIFAAQIAKQKVKPDFKSTSIATVKQEFLSNGLEVPIYVYQHGVREKVEDLNNIMH
jgi:hypothetical protein